MRPHTEGVIIQTPKTHLQTQQETLEKELLELQNTIPPLKHLAGG